MLAGGKKRGGDEKGDGKKEKGRGKSGKRVGNEWDVEKIWWGANPVHLRMVITMSSA